MRFTHHIPLLLSFAVLLAAQHVCATVLTFDSASYSIIAKSKAGGQSDMKSDANLTTVPVFAEHFSSHSSFIDADGNDNYGNAAASVSWSYAGSGGTYRIDGAAGGIADAMSFTTDTYALGSAALTIYFHIASDTLAALDSEGTYNSSLEKWSDQKWTSFYGGINGPDLVSIPSGYYRLLAGAGEESTGGGTYGGAGVNFSIQVEDAQATPEPSFLIVPGALVVIMAAFSRRNQ